MIRAVIFDCFGVLTTDGWLPFKQRHFGDNSQLATEATDLNKQANAGLLGHVEFTRNVAGLAGIDVKTAQREIDNNVTNDQLFDLIAELKPKMKIGLLSNAGGYWLDELFTPEQVKLFDAISLSYESGFIKPDERAYLHIAAKLSVEPEACVFVDDQERYCTAAAKLGMKTLVYGDFEQTKREIEELLGDTED